MPINLLEIAASKKENLSSLTWATRSREHVNKMRKSVSMTRDINHFSIYFKHSHLFVFLRLSFLFLSCTDFPAFVEMRVVTLQSQPASIVPYSNVNQFKPASTRCNSSTRKSQWTSFMICNDFIFQLWM